MKNLIARFVRDEQGQDLIEYALLAAVICGAYAQPYLATNKELGGRSDQEILRFSARPSSYLIATPDNVMWGQRFTGRSRSGPIGSGGAGVSGPPVDIRP